MPAQSSRHSDQPSPISQAVQIWGEGPEIVPYAAGFVPPSAFLPGVSVSGGGALGSGTSETPSSSQVPDPYDLEWTASDTAEFSFFFQDVCWTMEDPNPVQCPWAKTFWYSQVRMNRAYYTGYWWPPLFPLARYVMDFSITADYVEDDPDLGTGTLVVLNGGTFFPGEFSWDLQADQYLNGADPEELTNVRTWLSGKATVRTQITSPQKYPPSNWPIYSPPYLYP